MNDAKEEIKSRLAVEDVVGQYVELKRAGRNLKGHSPWGVDKTPSFMVSPEKGIWHDFSANKGGDIFTFIMEVEGIGFKEAMEKLAHQAGVDLSKYRGGDSKVSQKKARAKEALTLATKYYQACLVRNKSVCEYVFYKRNLNRATVAEFKIGYAPASGRALTAVLKKRGFTEQELDAAGLLNRFKTDMFRDRMTVPFMDTTGNIIGFTARIVGQGEPKYLNTPETILFNKSKFIFGLFQAKESIRRNGYVVIVEGNMDVISSHQAGVKEAVATSGTAMTEQHLKALSKLTSDIRLAYDGDEAGVKAAERAIMMAGDLGIPGKRKYSDIALKLISYIRDEVERASYEEKIAKKLGIEVTILREKGERLKKKLSETPPKYLKKPKTTIKNNKLAQLENSLLALKIYGGIVKPIIPIEVPDDETRLAELELIFNREHERVSNDNLEREATELLNHYNVELKKHQIATLTEQLSNFDEDSEEYSKILSDINNYMNAE